MQIKSIYAHALNLIFKHPYLWIIAAIAIIGDIRAVVAYNPTTTRLTVWVIVFAVIAILAEAALIIAILQHQRNNKFGFVDAIMTALTYAPQLLVLKVVPLVLFSFFFITLSVVGPLAFIVDSVFIKAFLVALLSLVGLLLLFFIQAWSFFSVCEIVTKESSIGESFSHAWGHVWQFKWQIVKICLPLIIIDLIVIVVMIVFGAISYESMFYRVISGEEADRQALLLGEGRGGSAGVEFTINRLANSILVMAFKNRGIEFASIPLFITNNVIAGVMTAVTGMLLMLLRTAVLALTYLQIARPQSAITESLRTTFKKA